MLRPGGRLLAVHDYGRDDVSKLRGDRPNTAAGRADGPFLGAGFKVRVLHCWWTFGSLDEARTFLDAAFGGTGRAVAGAIDADAAVLQRRGLPSEPRKGAGMSDRRSRDPYPTPRSGDTRIRRRYLRAPARRRSAHLAGGAVPRVAIMGSIVYMAFVLTVREATQIPLLASGAVMLAIVFAALAAFCVRSSGGRARSQVTAAGCC